MENVIGMIGDSVRRLLFVLMAVVLLPVFASAQGSFPSVDDFKLSSGALVNRAGDSLIFVDATGGDTVLIMSDNKFKVFDTLFCLNELIINADSATTSNLFFSNGLTNYIRWNASTSRFVLSHPLTLASLYSSGSNLDFYVSGTLEGRISSSGITAEDGSFYKDVVSADSGMATKHYADHYLMDDSISWVEPASRGDNYVLAWDTANDRWLLEAQLGDTGISGFGILYDTVASSQSITCTTSVWRGWNDSVIAVIGGGLTHYNAPTGGRKGDGLIVDSAGWYECHFAFSFNGANGDIPIAAFMVNSTAQQSGFLTRTITSTSIGSASMFGLLQLSAGDTISVVFTSNADGDVVGVNYAQMMVNLNSNESAGGGGGGSGSVDSLRINDGAGNNYDIWSKAVRLKIDSSMFNMTGADSSGTDTMTLVMDTAHPFFDSSIYADTAGAISGANIYGANSIDTSLLLDVVTLLGQSIETGDITDQTIIKDDIDTTTSFTFAPSFIGDGLQTDSAIATKGYVDAQAAPNLDTLMRNIGDTAGASSRYDLGAALTVDSIEGVTGGYATRWWSQQVRTKVIYDPDDNGFLIGGDGNDSIIIVGLPYHYNGISSVPADSQLMTKGYIDSITVTYADSAGRLREDSLTLAMIGQNGASDGQIMKWSSGSSAWVVGSDNTGSPFWDTVNTYGLNWFALVNGSDTLLNIQRTAGAVGKADTIDIFPADSAVLRLGAAGVTSVDSLAIDVDTITHLTGTFILNRGDTLHVDTGATGLKNYIAAYAGAVVSDSTAGDVDTAGTQIAAALDDRIRTNGDTTSQATFDFSSSRLEDIDYIIADSVGVTSTEFMRWDASNTRFSFSDDIYTGNTVIGNALYAYNNSIYANSAAGGSADNYFGMYVYDGSQTGASMLYRASSDFWNVSHSIYVNDTTDTDSLLTTEYHAKGLIGDTATVIRAEVEDSLDNYTLQTRFSNTLEVTPFSFDNMYGIVSDSVFKLPSAPYMYITAPLDDSVAWSADSLNGAVHAQGLYFPNGFYGWKYYITYTMIPTRWSGSSWISYPTGNETPYLAVSNDLNIWTSFTLGGSDTMSVPAVDTREYLRDSAGTAVKADFISDPTLYLEISDEYDTTLWMMYRPVWGVDGPNELALACAYLNVSGLGTADTTISLVKTNGSGDTLYVANESRTEASGNQDFVAPTLVRKSADNTYHLFANEYHTQDLIGWSNRDTTWYVRWTMNYPCSGLVATADTTAFPASVIDMRTDLGLSVRVDQDSALFWHISTQELYEGVYTAVANDMHYGSPSNSSDANNGNLWILNSYDDGLTWHTNGQEIVTIQDKRDGAWASQHWYMSYLMRADDGLKLVATGRKATAPQADVDSVDNSWNIGLVDIVYGKQTLDTALSLIRDTVMAVLDTIPIAINLLDTIEVDDELFIKMPTGGTIIGVYYDLLEGDSVRCRLYELGATTDTTSKVSVTDSVFSVTATYDSTVSFSNAVFDAGDYLYFGVESVHGDVGKLILNAVFTR